MVLGMALVFVFLALLIQAVNLAARIIHRVEGAPREDEEGAGDNPAAAARRAAAIAVALRLSTKKD